MPSLCGGSLCRARPFLPTALQLTMHPRGSAVYNLLVDELEADSSLLNIRGETVGAGCDSLSADWERSVI